VWNRTTRTAQEFVAEFSAESSPPPGAVAVETPSAVVAEIVFSALPDVDQFDVVVPDDVAAGWRSTRCVVVLSTTSPEKVRALGERLRPFGITVLDAPMSGGDAGARAGTLSLMVGGDADAFAAVEPVLRRFATTVEHLGDLGAGSVAKLANQVVVAATVTAVAEALDLARRSGLDVARVLTVLRGGLADSAVLRTKADRMVSGDFSLGGSITNQVKDLTYATALGDATGAALPVTRRTADVFVDAVAHDLGGQDHTAVYRLFENS
jgi:2-hydroxy-3-oxopropionate reductase